MTTSVIIFISVLVAINIAVFVWIKVRDNKENENPAPSNEPVEDQKPTDGIEPPSFEESQGEITHTPAEPKEEEPSEPPTEVQNGDPAVIAPVEDEKPKEEEPEPSAENDNILPFDCFGELIDYFGKVVKIEKGSKTYEYLFKCCCEAKGQYSGDLDIELVTKDNFPTIVDYYTDKDYKFAFEKLAAWLFYCVLAEIVPEKRSELCQMAYDYKQTGKNVPTFGYSFDTDPNNCRMVAACIWAMTRDAEIIPELRKELGGKMLKYKSDISECFIDICKFMPPAPKPYVKGYEKRKEEPVGDFSNDTETHKYVSQYYTLDTKDAEKRQATIQAIANKEYKKPHLFGKPRTVKDDKYGEMTFYPVFGKHNLGIEIPDNGAIANLCYMVGMASSNNRKPFLDQEYGRRRPGEGEVDGKANNNPSERVLVNYPIEENDGRSTGYYNQGGDYVDGQGNHIGDFETYYQNQVYANSYTSGHSAFIMGVGKVLMMVMPELSNLILKAVNEFANSRIICRYHWVSDTKHGLVIGTMMLPVMCGTENCEIDKQLKECRKEYEAIINGNIPADDKVNTSLSYVCGGYGSCHVDAGEQSKNHYCNKECDRERHPFINVSQRVEFTIDGAGVKTIDGKTSGTWEANTNYELVCPAVGENEEKVAVITMRNENGVRLLNYKLSRQGTKDEGTK